MMIESPYSIIYLYHVNRRINKTQRLGIERPVCIKNIYANFSRKSRRYPHPNH